ncbi:MAG: hypothetical protein RIR96_285, partial [Bacteroidota bacterium]
EAMMVGLPIIASDIPMNLEAVEHGVSAFVNKVKNVSDLTERMKQVQQDYHGSMMLGKNARRIALESFDIKQVSKQYTEALSRYKRKDI